MGNSIVGVSGMGWRSQRATKRVLACLAVIGAGGIAGLVAGFSADPVQTPELSPAEVLALRFPGGSNRTAANRIVAPRAPALVDPSPAIDISPTPAGYMLASVGDDDVSSLMFSPFPTYSSPATAVAAKLFAANSSSTSSSSSSSSAANSSPSNQPPANSPPPRPSLPPQLVTASVDIPSGALAYAAPDAAEPALPAARAESATAKRPAQPPRPNPVSQGPASPSNAVLNNAQIASIKERLKLTSYQNQLWPPVESALRDISWNQGRSDAGGKKLASNPHGGTVDPNSEPVQRLKSAAFPLIMSFSDDQKQEVRTMVRLMGLESLASQF